MEFKVKHYLKINWLLNNSPDGGAMQMVINSKPKNSIVVLSHQDKKARMWADVEPKQLLNIINKNYGLYEVIHEYPHKVYFDIDKKNNVDDDYYNKIINKINDLFPDGNIAVSGSHTETKTSYHIVLNNYLINNQNERQQIQDLVKYLKVNFDDGFDDIPYKNNQNFKCINQSKSDGRIQKIIFNEDAKKHIITAYFRTDVYNMPIFDSELVEEIELTKQVEESKKPFDLGSLPDLKFKLDDSFNIETATPLDLLLLCPLNDQKIDNKKIFNHSYTHLIARFAFNNGLSLEQFLSWYKQKSDKEAELKRWIYNWTKLDRFPSVSCDKITKLLIKFYPTIRRGVAYNNFRSLFNITDEKTIQPKLELDVLRSDEKFTILNTGMGSGKTYQTIKYLKDQNSFIWMTPIIALAQNTKYRLEQDDINCHYYKEASEEPLSNHDNLIICINSLYKLDQHKKYKIVVIDEIETLLMKWFNNDTIKHKNECWHTFIDIIKNADKVILLDAFTSNITLDFIKSFNSDMTIKLVELESEPKTRNVKISSSKIIWLDSIIKTLKENKKVFIFYPFKTGNSKNISMKALKNIIEKETNKSGSMYNADVDDKTLKELKNVNDSWSKSDFVITNSKITVGINYELKDYDTVFISLAGFTSTRDAIQVSYRCRHLESNLINVCYLDDFNNNKAFEQDDHQVGGCQIYKKLIKNILKEKYAPLKQSFNYFCHLAHYTILKDEPVLDQVLEDYFKKFNEADLDYSYDSIIDVNEHELKRLEDKVYISDATLEEKASIKKYYYNKKFIVNNSSDTELIKQSWDNKYTSFLEQVKRYRESPDNVFDKIKTFNNWTNIVDITDFKKIRLDDDIRTKIFNEYHFKDLTIKSTTIALTKNIYNAFFKKDIIKSYSHNKNLTYFINSDDKDMFNFGMTNLKIVEKDDTINIIDIESLLDKGIDKDDIDILNIRPKITHYKIIDVFEDE